MRSAAVRARACWRLGRSGAASRVLLGLLYPHFVADFACVVSLSAARGEVLGSGGFLHCFAEQVDAVHDLSQEKTHRHAAPYNNWLSVVEITW